MAEFCPTARIERLLVSTDGSEYSEGAVREAIKLAKTCKSELAAISVVETNPEFDAMAPQLVEKAGKDARGHVEAVQARAKKEGVASEAVVRQGEDSYKYIVEEARKRKSTMIVMGRRGRTGLSRLMMGSVTARVIGHAPCNVLVVPKSARIEFKNILIATDGSRYSAAAAAEAIGIAKRCGSKLTALGVVPSESIQPMDIVHSQMHRDLIAEKELKDAEKNVQALKEAAQKEGVTAAGLILGGKPAEAVIQTSKEKNADLIVVGSHGKTGLERLLMGSVTERVIVLSSCAVLVVKTT